MPVHKVESDGTFLRVWLSSDNFVEVLYASLTGTRAEQSAELVQRLQDAIDIEQNINTLPNDDPDKSEDPSLPNLFWRVKQGNRIFLVSRSVEITDAFYEEDIEDFIITIRRPR